MNFWEKMLIRFKDLPTVEYNTLQNLEEFKWIEFKEGVLIRVLPISVNKVILLECTMEPNITVGEHLQDYIESFLILEGLVKDLTSGVVMKADGKPHSWTVGTPHNPHSIVFSRLLITCKFP